MIRLGFVNPAAQQAAARAKRRKLAAAQAAAAQRTKLAEINEAGLRARILRLSKAPGPQGPRGLKGDKGEPGERGPPGQAEPTPPDTAETWTYQSLPLRGSDEDMMLRFAVETSSRFYVLYYSPVRIEGYALIGGHGDGDAFVLCVTDPDTAEDFHQRYCVGRYELFLKQRTESENDNA